MPSIYRNGIKYSGAGGTYTAGEGIDITNNEISVDTDDIQEKLVSGTNIKTVNNNSLLGSGNISITGGLQNLVDGSSTGSVRGIGSTSETSEYTMGDYAFAEGINTYASETSSHAEGKDTYAGGDYSHAEGELSSTEGTASHAEGSGSIASGLASHAEGWSTALGRYSHSEGYNTEAEGSFSHAQNNGTYALTKSQTVIGEYNAEDTNGSSTTRGAWSFVIGNGTASNDKSNALTVGWNGDVNIAAGAHYKINGVALPETKNVWYATSDTAAATVAKVATTSSGDFTLTTGNMVRIKFTNANTYNGTATLNIDGKGAVNITRVGTTTTTRYFWTAGEVVDFVYDGTNFVMSNKGVATTTYYGETKLSDSTASTSTSLAATANAVKTAYDLAAAKSKVTSTTASLTSTGWSSNSKTVSVTGVTASNSVLVTPAPASMDDYANCGIKCTAQAAGTLTFSCTTVPSSTITVNVMIID